MDETLHKPTAGAVDFDHTELGLKPGRRGKSCSKEELEKNTGQRKGEESKFGGKIHFGREFSSTNLLHST